MSQTAKAGHGRGARQSPAPNGRSQKWILAATILGSSMAFIDGTVVNVALPALQNSLNATVVDVQWVVESYALLLAALLLTGGSLGDHYGRKKIFVTGVAIFALASVWCGVAPSINQLIMARAVQGIGGALLVPGSLAIISASFDEDSRGPAIGTWSGFTAITTAFGPVLGGWLVEHVSWRAVFFLNIPIAVAVIFIAILHVPESRDSERSRLDWTGSILATIALGSTVYGLIESSRLGFRNAAVIGTLVCGGILIVVFLVFESRSKHPMLPLGIFRSTDFSGANLLTLFLYTGLSGALFFLPLNLIQIQKYSTTAAGAAMLPLILIMFTLSRWSGGLVKRYGARVPLIIGPLIAGAGFILFTIPSIGGSYWTTYFPAIVALGLGMAVSVAPLTTTVMGSVSQSRAGIASGINNAVSRTAGLLAIAVFGIVMLNVFGNHLSRSLSAIDLPSEVSNSIRQQFIRLAAIEMPQGVSSTTQGQLQTAVSESFLSGYRTVMFIAAGLAFLSSLATFVLIGRKNNSAKISG